MLSNSQIKIFASLRNKKYRELNNKFLAEGEKIVLDILNSSTRIFNIHSLIATKDFLETNDRAAFHGVKDIYTVSPLILEKISSLSSPNKAILVCEIPDYEPDYNFISGGYSLFLDDIRDPGNLGTIMRTADWFGIRHIFCSMESVDVFNPKVVQSTMGALCRVRVYYVEPMNLVSKIREKAKLPLIGTLMEGENIYSADLPSSGIIVMGNESRGISEVLEKELDYKLTIPSTGERVQGSESLNVATAAGIVMAEFRRRQGTYSK